MQMRMNTIMTMVHMKNNLDKNRILLGLSGGVDSTAAALLLKEKGFEVTGYYFDVLGDNTAGINEARAVAEQLGIEFISEDVSREFEEIIIGNFCSEYLCGRTPNPCIICNPLIKFRKLIETADRIGAYYIATGHYCRISHDVKTGAYHVRRAANDRKDQSYMLWRLGQDVLSRVIFPLGEFCDKEEIRAIAREKALQNAEKKDSQEICFINPEDNYMDYIRRRGYNSEPGLFVDKEGKILGEHKGILNYTVGQRKGLGIALGKPAFVTSINPETNQITIGDNEDLFSNTVIADDVFFTFGKAEDWDGCEVTAKVRYAAQPASAKLSVVDKKIMLTFAEAQRAATPGQSLVIYDGDKVIGGGFIE